MRTILTSIIILTIIILAGCKDIDVSKLSDQDLDRISNKLIVCDKPYIRHGSDCCLDQNDNKICDNDETGLPLTEEDAKEEEDESWFEKIKDKFKKPEEPEPEEEELTPQQQATRDEMINHLKGSGELLAFNRISITAQRGQPEEMYIGIKNTDVAKICFKIAFECTDGKTQPCPIRDIGSNDNRNGWFSTTWLTNVKGGDVDVIALTLNVPENVASDTYLAEINLQKGNAPCNSATDWTAYKTKQFYIEVS